MLLEGLFRSSFDKPGRPSEIALSVEFETAKSEVHYTGPQLTVPDLRALQALLAIASTAPRISKPKKSDPEVVHCSFNWLAQVAGYKSPGSEKVNAVLEHALGQLSKGLLHKTGRGAVPHAPLVTLLPATRENVDAGAVKEPRRQGLRVELHPLLTAAIRAGKKGTHFLELDMHQVRELKQHPTRLLHHRLCHLNPDEDWDHGLDRLASYIATAPWDSLTRSQRDHSRKRASASIKELEALGWKFTDVGKTQLGVKKYNVKRPPSSFVVES